MHACVHACVRAWHDALCVQRVCRTEVDDFERVAVRFDHAILRLDVAVARAVVVDVAHARQQLQGKGGARRHGEQLSAHAMMTRECEQCVCLCVPA
jgi:hypothetical protein